MRRYIIRHTPKIREGRRGVPHWPIHYQTPAASRRYIIRHDPRGASLADTLSDTSCEPPIHYQTRPPRTHPPTRSTKLPSTRAIDTVYLARSRCAFAQRASFLKADKLSDAPEAAPASFPKADTLSDTSEAARGSFPKADILSSTSEAPPFLYKSRFALFGNLVYHVLL